MSARYTLAEIAEALKVTKSAVGRRAKKESWPFEELCVRGGKQHLYVAEKLPRAIVRKLAARAAIKAVKAASGGEVTSSFIVVIDGEVFEVRRIPA